MKVAVPTPRRTTAARESLGPKSASQRIENQAGPGLPLRGAPVDGSLEDNSACLHHLRRTRNQFHLNSLVAQVLFVQLHEHAEAQYETATGSKQKSMQTGHAWRTFSSLFEPVSAIELVRLFENLLRFANDEAYAPARSFFLAYAPLSFEHDISGEYIGPGVWKPEAGSRIAALRVRRTLKRWCEWLEALIHFQVHQIRHVASVRLELDKAIILLWPLLKRYNWSYRGLLMLLRSHSNYGNCFPCQSEQQLASYCRDFLGLRGAHPAMARFGALSGQAAAERLLKFLPSMV
jgi:hypothetical protein